MELLVLSPRGTILKEDVDEVLLPGAKGDFMVLNDHAPIVSTLKRGVVRYRKNTEVKNLDIENGITIVEQNTIKVFVD
jgi:F0F1-type ATP synthase, epsilon subunit (mitochondrial delta subunit)